MEQIAKLTETEVPKIFVPTLNAFLPLLEQRWPETSRMSKKTFQFGDTERHKLDLYFPLTESNRSKTPILFFIYGGAFTSGDRTLPDPYSLGYANVAAYFTQRGFITVIADYRLVPHVHFPVPAEDVRDAIEWVVAHPDELVTTGTPEPDMKSLFILGHSAGAVHAATVLLHPDILPLDSPLRAGMKGIILVVGSYHYHPEGGTVTGKSAVTSDVYWGGPEETRKGDPMGLLESASSESVAALPPLLMVQAENDPEWVKIVGKDFYNALLVRDVKVEKTFASGHNHISLTWALGAGEGEEWAEDSVTWMRTLLQD